MICNLIVVSGGIFHARRTRFLDLKAALPFLIASVPCAFLGGLIPVSEVVFLGTLAFALGVAGARLLIAKSAPENFERTKQVPLLLSIAIGGALGLLSGLVGIGGGIFLAPILYFLRWNPPRIIAATASLFIFVNSLSGLVGQSIKLTQAEFLPNLLPYWPLAIVVLIGGQLGSFFSMNQLPASLIQRLTGILILVVAGRLVLKLLPF